MSSDYSVTSQGIARVTFKGDSTRPPTILLLFRVPNDSEKNDGILTDEIEPHVAVPSGKFNKGALITLVKAPQGASGNPTWELLAEANSPLAALFELLHRAKLNPLYPEAVRKEASRWTQNPRIGDPALRDLTHIPFCTIDNDDSRDLDQALHISRTNSGGFLVLYALADAAFYAYPGSALFAHALRRGTSYYLPRLSVPMLPPSLSEGVVSLNPNVDRRSLVFHMELDSNGLPIKTELSRSRIRSRAKLSYRGVQKYYDRLDPEFTAFSNQLYTETLDLLQIVGPLRILEAESRDVIRYDRTTLSIDLSSTSVEHFNLSKELRYDTDRYNEQISLLCNREGARFLERDGGQHPEVQPVFRVHSPPNDSRFWGVDKFIHGLVAARNLDPQVWDWKEDDESVSTYLQRLPTEQDEERRIKAAIERQFLVINQRSTYSGTPGLHFGLGVDPYSRFSAPMREAVGIFTHKEALEKLGLAVSPALANVDPKSPESIAKDTALREAVIKSADAAKTLQSQLGKAVDSLAIDAFFKSELEKPFEQRTRYSGTVMGLAATRVYLTFDDPPLEIKIYIEDLENFTRKRWSVSSGRESKDVKGSKLLLVAKMTEEDRKTPFSKNGNGKSTTSAVAAESDKDIRPGRYAEFVRKQPILVGDKLVVVIGGFDEIRKRWMLLPV